MFQKYLSFGDTHESQFPSRIELDYEYQTKSNVFFETVLSKEGSYNLFIVLSKHSQEITLLLFLRLSIHETNEERISDTKEKGLETITDETDI